MADGDWLTDKSYTSNTADNIGLPDDNQFNNYIITCPLNGSELFLPYLVLIK